VDRIVHVENLVVVNATPLSELLCFEGVGKTVLFTRLLRNVSDKSRIA